MRTRTILLSALAIGLTVTTSVTAGGIVDTGDAQRPPEIDQIPPKAAVPDAVMDMLDPPTTPPPASFHALTPARLFDTRPGEADGTIAVTKQHYGGDTILRIKVTGTPGVPDTGVAAVSLNVTAVNPTGNGYVTVYPCGDRPLAANINYVHDQIIPNAVIAPISATGEICLYSLAPTHLVADLNGWFATGTGFQAITPARLFDTRPGEADGTIAVTKQHYGGDTILRIKVTGTPGVPDTGVAAVSLNVTAVNPTGNGYVTVYPCGDRPLAANINYVHDQIIPNAVIAPISATGEICLYSLAPTHLVADLNGGFATGTGFQAITPARLFDTRPGEADGTIAVTKQHYGGDTILRIKVTGTPGVPDTGVAAVSLNVTAVNPTGNGYVTVYPCGDRPLAANINYVHDQIIPNAVIAPISATGEICLYSLAPTHLVADLNGWFAT